MGEDLKYYQVNVRSTVTADHVKVYGVFTHSKEEALQTYMSDGAFIESYNLYEDVCEYDVEALEPEEQ